VKLPLAWDTLARQEPYYLEWHDQYGRPRHQLQQPTRLSFATSPKTRACTALVNHSHPPPPVRIGLYISPPSTSTSTSCIMPCLATASPLAGRPSPDCVVCPMLHDSRQQWRAGLQLPSVAQGCRGYKQCVVARVSGARILCSTSCLVVGEKVESKHGSRPRAGPARRHSAARPPFRLGPSAFARPHHLHCHERVPRPVHTARCHQTLHQSPHHQVNMVG
jgi:hypothetical protein